MRTLGRMMPISAATFCRTRWMRSSRSPPRFGIGQPDQPDADLDFHRIDGQVVLDPLFGRLGGFGFVFGLGRRPHRPALRGASASAASADAAAAERQQRNRAAGS